MTTVRVQWVGIVGRGRGVPLDSVLKNRRRLQATHAVPAFGFE